MRNVNTNALLLLLIFITTSNVIAQDTTTDTDVQRFYVKPYAGFIGIQNMSLQLQDNTQTSNISVENGFGFTTGIAAGYNFTKNIVAEIGWEYKSNTITVENTNIRSTGDYASNFIYLNGIYNFTTESKWKPYVGLGASLIQEIDLDFGQGENTSFSTSGNVGLQGNCRTRL